MTSFYKKFVFSVGIFFIFVCLGCQTAPKIQLEEQDRSLADLRKAILSVMGEPRHVSENQREYYSQYFSRVAIDKFDPSTAKERQFARITILGDRRPYIIDVAVFVEKRVGQQYQTSGLDKSSALQIRKDIKNKLVQGQDGMNVIDDFRAF